MTVIVRKLEYYRILIFFYNYTVKKLCVYVNFVIPQHQKAINQLDPFRVIHFRPDSVFQYVPKPRDYDRNVSWGTSGAVLFTFEMGQLSKCMAEGCKQRRQLVMTAVEMILYTSHSAYFKTGIVIDHVRGVTYQEPKCLRYVTGLYTLTQYTWFHLQ